MKKTYNRPESSIVRLRLSSNIADETAGPGYTTSRTVDPGAIEAKGTDFYFGDEKVYDYKSFKPWED